MEIQLNFIVKVYFIIHNLQRLLQEDLNGCWSCEVYTNDVELFKCIPSQENEIWLGYTGFTGCKMASCWVVYSVKEVVVTLFYSYWCHVGCHILV